MTNHEVEHEDRAGALFRQAFERHAGDAPAPDGMLAGVQARRGRQRRWSWGVGGSVLLAAASTALVLLAVGDVVPSPAPPEDRTAEGETAAPTGFRLESYQGTEVQVPKTWGYGTTDSARAWCADVERRATGPYVGRPGAVRDILCPAVPPLDARRSYLWFDSGEAKPGVRRHDHGWVEETRMMGGVPITVFTDDDRLREEILDSARAADGEDTYGCPVRHALADDPAASPDPGVGGLGAVGEVDRVVRCTYTSGIHGSPTGLFAGSALEGAGARAAVNAILAAPEGGGPNYAGDCATQGPAHGYGDEALLLIVHGSKGSQQVVVRYSGCDHNGIDDGDTVRTLTRDAVERLLTEPHLPRGFHNATADVLEPLYRN